MEETLTEAIDLPRRPRRPLLTPWSALLFAVVVGAAGFLAGVRVEKGQVSSAASAGGALAARLAARGSGGAVRAAAGRAAGGGFLARFGGAAGGGGATIGTVSSIDGRTLYVTEPSGTTVKVRLSSATSITKSEAVGRRKVYPGDAVVIAGVAGSNGTVSATSVTDTGSRASGAAGAAGAAGGSSGSSGSSGNAAISSLFSGG